MSDDSPVDPTEDLPRFLPASAAATDWVVRKDRGLAGPEKLQFEAWLAESPQNREAYFQALDDWRRMDQLSAVGDLAEEADAIIARAQANRRRRTWLYSGLAGLAAAAVIVLSVIGSPARSSRLAVRSVPAVKEKYQVMESTAHQMKLSDGSRVELNGDARIEVDFTPDERRVRLVAGEAHFFVAKDAVHPFLVFANGVIVRAVGTAFDVRLAASSVEVLVTEGKILLHNSNPHPTSAESAPSLIAGEMAVVNTTATSTKPMSISKAGALEMNQALAWQSTRLVFDRTPLENVIAAFNHYNDHQLIIGAPELRTRTLSGVFRADNLEGFIRLLQVSIDVRAEKRSEHETVLIPVR